MICRKKDMVRPWAPRAYPEILKVLNKGDMRRNPGSKGNRKSTRLEKRGRNLDSEILDTNYNRKVGTAFTCDLTQQHLAIEMRRELANRPACLPWAHRTTAIISIVCFCFRLVYYCTRSCNYPENQPRVGRMMRIACTSGLLQSVSARAKRGKTLDGSQEKRPLREWHVYEVPCKWPPSDITKCQVVTYIISRGLSRF